MKLLRNIQSRGEGYVANVIEDDDSSVFFLGDMDTDWDGSHDWRRDPYGQAETSYKHNGQSLDGQNVQFIVLPPEIILAVRPLVLGCKVEVRFNGKTAPALVGDIGPRSKLGEGSPRLCNDLGINDDPVKGGISEQAVLYRFWPGLAAVIGGITYDLQPYHG